MNRLDLVLVNPGNRCSIYQNLGPSLAAIEPPVWAGLLATFARHKGFSVQLIDANALGLGPEQVAEQVQTLDPCLTAVVVFGHQPSASTQNMGAARLLCEALKARRPSGKIILLGGHVSALPRRTLEEECADFVCEGEGPYTLEKLLSALAGGESRLDEVPGLWYRNDGAIRSNPPAPLVNDLDRELNGVAWDLLPMDRYRAHNWHCFGHLDRRTPYASIYTSLGCPFKCVFCCINAPFGKPTYRLRDPRSVLAEIDLLVSRYGVRNLKILDEMFVLNLNHVQAICDGIVERRFDLNIWAYARVDTVKPRFLQMLKKAGVNWLALGIESGSSLVRDGARKSFDRTDCLRVVRQIQDAGIHVIGNYIFGLPDDTLETMQQTLDLAQELNCEMANLYVAMAYPGSQLYALAVQEGWPLPPTWEGFSQHAPDTLPLPTRFVDASVVLEFRDEAFTKYFTDPRYLEMITRKFGPETTRHIEEMVSHKLVRNARSVERSGCRPGRGS
ncbi:MAG: cobalamin B12-binding domain-containing protein [Candidatus Riflebacteria bacterium]|nr:cobalamin B12-binding domain-containing protein [Candidatus Riflebacteria bacterium]